MLTALVSVPLTLHYLGTERYGMWMAMIAFTAMLGFADLGIGNGVLSTVARSHGRDELHTVQHYVSSAFALLSLCGLLILAVLAMLYPVVPWHKVFNVTSASARSEAGPAIATFIVCFAFALPLGIVQRVQMGMQMGFVASLWQCGASLSGLISVLLAIWLKASLPWLVFAYAGAPLIVAAVNNLVFFRKVQPEFAPRWRSATRSHASELARIGFLFFVLQLAVAVTYTSDSIVIAQKLGAEQVAHFAVPDRLFALASMIVGFATTPLWPAFGEALARGDKAWTHRMLIRATLLSFCTALAVSLFFLLTGQYLIGIWVGPTIQTSLPLLLGFAIWRTTEASFGAATMYLNALRDVKFQIVIVILTAVAAITLKLHLVQIHGISIMPWITAGTFLIFAGVPTWIRLRKTSLGVGKND